MRTPEMQLEELAKYNRGNFGRERGWSLQEAGWVLSSPTVIAWRPTVLHEKLATAAGCLCLVCSEEDFRGYATCGGFQIGDDNFIGTNTHFSFFSNSQMLVQQVSPAFCKHFLCTRSYSKYLTDATISSFYPLDYPTMMATVQIQKLRGEGLSVRIRMR